MIKKVLLVCLIILLIISPVFASEIQVGSAKFTLNNSYPNSHFINENYYTNNNFSIRECQTLDYIFGHRANDDFNTSKIGNHDVIKLKDENQTFIFFSVGAKFYCINGTNLTNDVYEIINASEPSVYSTQEFLNIFIKARADYLTKETCHIYENIFLVNYEENCVCDHTILAIKHFFQDIYNFIFR